MEQYFEKEVEAVLERIRRYAKPGCFLFSMFSDVHTHEKTSIHHQVMVHTLETMEAVHKKCNIDGLFFLGDCGYVEYNDAYPAEYWTMGMLNETLEYLTGTMKQVNRNAFLVAGNHDGLHADYPNPKHFYEKCIVGNERDCNVTTVKDKGYYYVDYPDKKVRCICLMCCCQDETGRYDGYTQDQLHWLCKEALCVPKGTDILLFTHRPVVCNYPKEWTEDLSRLLEAYKKRTVCMLDGVTYDFAEETGCLCALFHGDGHYDWIDRAGFVCPTVEIACALLHEPRYKNPGWWMPQEAYAPKRYPGTAAEVAWDTVIFNPEEKDIVMIRFGAGQDRYCKL